MDTSLRMQIVRVPPDELRALHHISVQTFTETFASQNTPEDMEKYLAENLSLNRLTAELQNPRTQFYFALLGDGIAGYLKLNLGEAQTELKDSQALEIERIYVLKKFQGAQVGKALFQHAVMVAREHQMQYIWLGVWEENHKAIAFYEKQGFVAFDKHVFVLGNDPQTDIMMKLML